MDFCMTTSGMTDICHEEGPEVASQHTSVCVDADDPEVHSL